MSALSSKTFLSAVDAYVKTPSKDNRDALVAAADEYRELRILGQASDTTLSRKHTSNVNGTPTQAPNFDLSRIMDDLQIACA